MKVTLEIKTVSNDKREVTVSSEESGTTRRIYTNTNAIFPLYKELIFFCRAHMGEKLEVCSNSASFIADLRFLDEIEKRLAMMLKDTLVDTACTIQSVTHLTK